MNYRPAKPGKPGHWNGRKQRWRKYVRTFRRMDPEAAKRVADRELAMKAKYVRAQMIATYGRAALRWSLAIAALGALVAVWWLLHRGNT